MSIFSPSRVGAWVVLAALWLVALPLTAHAQVAQPDDGGSGRDAGDDFATAVPIEPGVLSTGSLNIGSGVGPPLIYAGGDTDWFTFSARAGQRIWATIIGSEQARCGAIIAPDETTIGDDTDCTGSVHGVVAPVDGTYALEVAGPVADEQTYQLSIGLDAPASVGADLGTPSGSAAGQVVVAVADSGVNPYHDIYYRPQNTAHPCTWVEGFDDCSIPALELSIGEYDTFAEAYEADREVWESLKTHQWYWIPRTNIIGAVCDGTSTLQDGDNGVCIIDEDGHGTGTTSSVLTEVPDALLLVHEGNSGAYDLETAPVVPDIQSHSWGPAAPLPLHAAAPAGAVTGDPPFAYRGAFDAETIFFIAAGNEAPFPTFLDWNRVNPEIQVVGAGHPAGWTLRSWSAYDFASWWCRPAAAHDDLHGYVGNFCGTSAAAPTAAGTAAAALLEIRRHEGTTMRSTPDMVSQTVSRGAFIDALRAGATYAPAPDRFRNRPEVTGGPLVQGAEHLSWGYGWLDRTRVDAIVACALNDVCPAKSAAAEEYNARRQDVRRATTYSSDWPTRVR